LIRLIAALLPAQDTVNIALFADIFFFHNTGFAFRFSPHTLSQPLMPLRITRAARARRDM